MNLYEKLLIIQTEITSLKADKSSTGYKYLSTNKIMDYVKPRMNVLKLLLVQEIVDFENTRMDYRVSIKEIYEGGKSTNKFTEGKPKTEILTKVKMNMVWIDVETGEKLVVLWGANGQNDWEKGLGSALTYGERYFVMKFFHISTDEDDVDNPNRKNNEMPSHFESKAVQQKRHETTKDTNTKANTREIKEVKKDIIPITENQIKRIQILINESGCNKDNIYSFFKIKSSKELNSEEANSMVEMLLSEKKKQNGKIDMSQMKQLLALLKLKGYTKKDLLNKKNLKTLDDMSYKDANEILENLEKMEDK